MRVLVTRPQAEAERTAARLLSAGHTPILAPVTEIVPTEAPLPPGPFDIVIATSAAAIGMAPQDLHRLPLMIVGERSAAQAVRLGWQNIRTIAATAAALAETCAALPAGTRVLYLAGWPRKPQIERALAAHGIACIVHLAYVARALPLDVAIWDDPPEAVLHYSRASAERFWAAAGDQAHDLWHICLSADVAAGLPASARVAIAAKPDEAALFAALNLCH